MKQKEEIELDEKDKYKMGIVLFYLRGEKCEVWADYLQKNKRHSLETVPFVFEGIRSLNLI